MLLETPGLESFISAVILVDETTRQKTDSGKGNPFPEFLEAKGIVPGVKVDAGLKDEDPAYPHEPLAEGLDDLAERLKKYNEESNNRLRFTKWRQTIPIGPHLPHRERVEKGMARMAAYARINHEYGFVPIVEPEILMSGKEKELGSHSGERCREVSEMTLKILFEKLDEEGIDLRFVILKTNMVIPGAENEESPWPPARVGEETYSLLSDVLPESLPGVAFLSGGMKPRESTANLNAIAIEAKGVRDTRIYTCSYGRALQDRARKTWAGKVENVDEARKTLLEDARQNSLAQEGKWRAEMDPREED